jgi:hypothetical protein
MEESINLPDENIFKLSFHNFIFQVMSEMEKQSMPIKSYVLFDCIVNLVTNSHKEHVPEVSRFVTIVS